MRAPPLYKGTVCPLYSRPMTEPDIAHQWNEADFLAMLEQEPLPYERLEQELRHLYATGNLEAADSSSELLQEALAARGDLLVAVAWLAERLALRKDDKGLKEACRKQAEAILAGDRDRRVFLEHVGFDQKASVAESLRRLQVLLALQPGALCFDKTWGFGVVDRVDTFYKKVTIDFTRKRGHEMAFGYAGETLQILDDEHILARKHRDPQAIAEMVKGDPAEIVRLTLRSYGPMPIARLQETLTADLVPEAEWKKFWDAARKELKKDPLVEIPAKRTLPLRLLESAHAYDADWFAALGKERNINELLRAIRTLQQDEDVATLDAEAHAVLAERLAFAMLGAQGVDPAQLASAIMLAMALPETARPEDLDSRLEAFFDDRLFADCAVQLSARDLRAFIAFLLERDAERAGTMYERLIPVLPVQVLSEIMSALVGAGRESSAAEALRRGMNDPMASIDLLAWVAVNLEQAVAWGLGTQGQLANRMVKAMEIDAEGSTARGRNQLRGQFENPDWLQKVLGSMRDMQRREFLGRIRESSAFEEMDRRSVMGQMIKLFPELEQELAVAAEPEDGARARGPVTSERSYRERQLQLERITKVEIPQNSKEIAVARSYGDLRENAEFKAAKEMQGILLRREGELQQMLARVRPTDFSDFVAETAGIGTGVQVAYADGREEWFYILGEWDRDEALGIISCETQMAKTLDGHKPGDELMVPSEEGEIACVVRQVVPLPEPIRAWAVAVAEVEA